MGRRVTIYDIAKEAGTSTSTVSRVLNGSSLVTLETSAAVRSAASRLGYAARRIRRHATRTVLHVVVFIPNARDPVSHLFYDAAVLFNGIRNGFGDVRAHLIVSINGSTESLNAKTLGDIDGCLFAFASPPPAVRNMLEERSIPTVVINRVDGRFSSVVNDAGSGMRALLVEVAKRRPSDQVCFLSARDAGPVAEYRASAIQEAGRTMRRMPGVRWFPTVVDITPDVVDALCSDGYRTFMCVNDFVAAAVYERLLQLGLRVPEDVGITGYDAAPVRGLLSRTLTTVDLCVPRLGQEASRLLVPMIMERQPEVTERVVTGGLVRGDTL